MLKKNLYKPDRIYENSLLCKDDIFKENRYKGGIYEWYNTINNKSYVGRSISLSRRLLDYYNRNYWNKYHHKAIFKDLLKYGNENFNLNILEYCDNCENYNNYDDYLDYIENFMGDKEQYYIDLINPEYNIQKSTKYTIHKGYSIIVTNIKDGTINKYPSLRAVARDIEISYSKVLRHFNNNLLLNDTYLISEV